MRLLISGGGEVTTEIHCEKWLIGVGTFLGLSIMAYRLPSKGKLCGTCRNDSRYSEPF